jgi:hypothetical protein
MNKKISKMRLFVVNLAIIDCVNLQSILNFVSAAKRSSNPEYLVSKPFRIASSIEERRPFRFDR